MLLAIHIICSIDSNFDFNRDKSYKSSISKYKYYIPPGTNCDVWKKSIRYEGKIPNRITKINKRQRRKNDDDEVLKF